MVTKRKFSLAIAIACVAAGGSLAQAEIAVPLNIDPNFEDTNMNTTPDFGDLNVFNFGLYTFDDTAIDGANDLLVQSQNGIGSFNDGAGFAVFISNGENGIDSTEGGLNMDVPNVEPADPVFTTIGNGSGKLENGNVLRASYWVRNDPNDPIPMGTPTQIEPVIKFELWKEALSGNQDTTGGANPGFGDKIFDQDINGADGQWLDISQDGATTDPAAAGEGRLNTFSTTEWSQVVVTYEVDDTGWAIGAENFTVADVEEVRAAMFWGDFAGNTLTGSLWIDNILLEVFADSAAEAASDVTVVNPDPGTASVIPGDADCDGDVDLDDFNILAANFGQTTVVGKGVGDFDGDGDTDLDDFNILAANFGTGPESLGSLPEPGSLALLGLGGLAMLRRRSA